MEMYHEEFMKTMEILTENAFVAPMTKSMFRR
jgi:hypothetical protein